jgi:hypothetical protein
MPPAWILACQPQHQGPYLGWHGRASARAGRLPPLPPHEGAMPPQQRARGDQSRTARGGWQVTSGRREQRAISGAKLRPRHLATQYLELMAQDQQLEVLDVQPTATSDDRAQQRPEREVEEQESHTGDRFQPTPRTGATRLLAPFSRPRTPRARGKRGRAADDRGRPSTPSMVVMKDRRSGLGLAARVDLTSDPLQRGQQHQRHERHRLSHAA